MDESESFKRLLLLWQEAQDDLDRRTAALWAQIRSEVDRSSGPRRGRLKAQIARLDKLQRVTAAAIDALVFETADYLSSEAFSAVYASGAAEVAAATGIPFTFTQPHIAALQVLADDTFDDVLRATAFIDVDSKKFVRATSRRLTALSFSTGDTNLQQARKLRRELQRSFERKGIGGMEYADGSLHGFGEYSRMLLRTKTAVARNVGTLNHGTRAGVQFYEILDSHDCGLTSHHDPDKPSGRVVRRNVAEAFPISHPNCVRALAPRLDVTAETALLAPSVVPPERAAAQVTFEQALRRQAARRAGARARRRRRVRVSV